MYKPIGLFSGFSGILCLFHEYPTNVTYIFKVDQEKEK